jgi:pyruvate dehydrogenase E1 component
MRRPVNAQQVGLPSVAAQEVAVLERLAQRIHAYATKMIFDANNRDDVMEGDPKVGGHPAACASSVHLLTAIHASVRGPFDMLAVKPHASPVDHSLGHAFGLLRDARTRRWLTVAEGKSAMTGLRKFSPTGEGVFQSYHSEWDADGEDFFPSGSVGIPPVSALYTALAYRYALDHGWEAPIDAHFWCLMGDSEFREGSLMEAMPEAAEREIGNLTWIVDYNRQNLDGARIINSRGLGGTDADRIERVSQANGWEVLQLRHGRRRLAYFAQPGTEGVRAVLEHGLTDFAFNALLAKKDGAAVRAHLLEVDAKLDKPLAALDDGALYALFADLGGHDMAVIVDALRRSKADPRRPTMIVAHTAKGWGLECMASPGNHSALPEESEVVALLTAQGLDVSDPYALPKDAEVAALCAARGQALRAGVEARWAMKDRNEALFAERGAAGLPETLSLDLKYLPLVHTQYVWGQLAAKLIRLGHQAEAHRRGETDKPLTGDDHRWAPAAELVVTMAPDVGTSTNINPAMDDRVYGPDGEVNWEQKLGVGDRRRPVLVPSEDTRTRHIRFEIAEANCMTAVGSFGKMRDRLGLPLLPVMTVYDFFIKRALDQLYYNLYWRSGFVVVGTPRALTLSPEGAQHSWKSDIQMPNLITWEPFFAVEVDWILADTARRHYTGDNVGRTGVIIRAVTRAIRQAELLKRLKTHARFAGWTDADILEATRKDALAGAYYLVDHRGAPGYEPGENVVHVLSMGSVTTEALDASDRLLAQGIYANVLVVTSADLLVGNLGHDNDYHHLHRGLGIDGDLHLVRGSSLEDRADFVEAAGRRVPLVAVVDGEPGLLDNVGSIVGVRQETLALRKASKSGRPVDVFNYLHIDGDAVFEACGQVLSKTALENVRVSRRLLAEVEARPPVLDGPTAEAGAALWPPRQ